MCVCVCRPPSEEGEGVGVGREIREAGSPPVEVRAEERREIFAARQKLSKILIKYYVIRVLFHSVCLFLQFVHLPRLK